MPGDELVPGCQYHCTRAITIDAPPAAVWRWLVQVGFGKAGFYSNDLLDNAGHPSADRVLDGFQHPEAGDWVRGRRPHPPRHAPADPLRVAVKAVRRAGLALPERARRLPDDAEDAPDAEAARRVASAAGGADRVGQGSLVSR
jgi:hypothetical protein